MGRSGWSSAAAVAAAGGLVVFAGPEAALPELEVDRDAVRLDAGGRAVLPGFVDAHTHLVFAGERADEFAARLRGVGYEEALAAGGGINRTVRETRAASDAELEATAATRLDTALRYGTTTLEAKSGYGLTVDDERRSLEVLARLAARSPVEVVPTFLGAHLIPEEYAGDRDGYLDLLEHEMLPACAPLAEFVDAFCDRGALTVEESRRVLAAGARHGLRTKLHANELGSTGGAALAAELGCVSADHLLFCDDAGGQGAGRRRHGGGAAARHQLPAPHRPGRPGAGAAGRRGDDGPGDRLQPRHLLLRVDAAHGRAGLRPRRAHPRGGRAGRHRRRRPGGRAGRQGGPARPRGRLRPGRAGRAELPRPGLPPRGQPGRAGRQGRHGGGRAVTDRPGRVRAQRVRGAPPEVVDELVAAFAGADPGVLVLDRSSDPDHNRTVITLAGPGPALVEAAVAGARACVRLIDLNRHRGVHPRMGALDVLPFVPFGEATRLSGAGDPDLDCAALAERAGRRIAAEVGVPVYLYGAAARRPERAALPAVRGRGFEALRDAPAPRGHWFTGDHPGGPPDPPDRAPDFGGPGLHPTAGATAVGAREVLVAYNVELAGADLDLARRIAAAVRERDGGLPAVRAMGVALGERGGPGDRRGGPPEGRGLVQVSMNLLDYRATPPAAAYAAVAELAGRAGARVEASEIVGLVPAAALAGVDPADLRLRGDVSELLLENRLARAMDSQLEETPMSPQQRLGEHGWLDAYAAPTVTPGGGSASAVAGALGCALLAMAARIGAARPSRRRPRRWTGWPARRTGCGPTWSSRSGPTPACTSAWWPPSAPPGPPRATRGRPGPPRRPGPTPPRSPWPPPSWPPRAFAWPPSWPAWT